MKNNNAADGGEQLQKKIKLLTGKDFWNTQDYPEINAPSFRFSDGPHGLRLQSGKADNFGLNGSAPATCFAENSCAACSWDEEILYGTGARLGREAAYFGVNVLLGPAVNIKRNPKNGRNFEYFSEDPYLTGKLASSFIRGVQQSGVSCCVKHYAANNREYARTLCDSVVSERALREIYLMPFEMCVKEGNVGAVMTAYNKVNGVHCSENKRLISDILRGEWGFDGIVVSDWAGTCDRVAGIKAGEDIEMPRCNLSADEINAAIKSGGLTAEDVDRCADRISRFASKLGERTYQCDFAEHSDFVRRCAENSIVLLKNSILPLKKGARVAVIGALAENEHIQGGGSAKVNCRHTGAILGCLKEKFDVCGYERGYNLSGKASGRLIKRALRLAKGAEAVMVFAGLTDREDSEGGDKQSISLPLCQIQLIEELKKAGCRVVVCLATGSAADTSWDEGVAALLQTGLYGQSGAQALASILCGEVNPSGKIAESYPVNYGDIPCAASFGTDPRREEYTEDVFVGYRWYDGAGISPKYPFGYGLSYTTFQYSGIAADENGVSFTITNTGKCGGAEAAQVYISYPDCGRLHVAKALKGFKKVYLAAGESACINIPFDEYTFRLFDANFNSWRIFGGEYGVMVGASSRDIRLTAVVKVSGERGSKGMGTRRDGIIEAAKNAHPASVKAEEGRKEITLYSAFADLKRARGIGGRLLYRIGKKISSRGTALQTLDYIYIRSVAQYAGFNGAQAEGLLLVCNGRFFKGIKKIILKK